MSSRTFRTFLAPLIACLGACLLPGSASASFGVEGVESAALEQNGGPAVQAGSHPFEVTTGFSFHQTSEGIPDGNVKDVQVELPAGLVGDPGATAEQCTSTAFTTEPVGFRAGSSYEVSNASCPASTQVGVAFIELIRGAGYYLGIYNLVPPPGVPAEFGFNPVGLAVKLTPKVRTGGDYGVTVNVDDASQAKFIYGVKVSFWGVPEDPAHDGLRGECLGQFGESLCSQPTEASAKPFLTMPTSCSGEPLTTVLRVDSWQEPGAVDAFGAPLAGDPRWQTATPPWPALVGCDRLGFAPSVSAVRPDTTVAGQPAGLEVDLRMPQSENPGGLAEANLKSAVVTLPAGMSISPSAAFGLAACSPAEIGLDNAGAANCPEASRIGSVTIDTPLLNTPLEGSVYLAQQNENPFGSLLALYIVAESQGVLLKLAGLVEADPVTGQLTARFGGNPPYEGLPQQPFSELKMTLFGGPRAPLVTPTACGTYAATATLTPWSGGPAVSPPVPPFNITSGCGGGFAPALSAGGASSQAGAYSAFSSTFSRGDEDQRLGGVSLQTPPGLSAIIANVALCPEPQAQQGACPAASRIGSTTVGAGPGPAPLYLPEADQPEDPVYLTGPTLLEGPNQAIAPFGLSVVVQAKAGPFNLGPVVVRAAVNVDPHTAQITVTSEGVGGHSIPTILDGIPLDLRMVNVTVDRSRFVFNPTSCDPLTVDATLTSTQGASVARSTPFQVTNCAKLAFKPKFTASTAGRASKAAGASLDVRVTAKGGPQAGGPQADGGQAGGGEANIRSVKVDLPKQLPSRLSTLQKACTAAQFAANPAGCPAASNVGAAVASTPVLAHSLTGPAYLVSHGGEAFPDLEIVLQGEGITLILDGNTEIRKGITSSTFRTVPDAPITSFELRLPAGPHSILSANVPAKARYDLCGQTLAMPTAITGQNGAVLRQATRIAVSGCPRDRPRVKKGRAKTHSRVKAGRGKHDRHKQHASAKGRGRKTG